MENLIDEIVLVFMSAVLEYLTVEVLLRAGNVARHILFASTVALKSWYAFNLVGTVDLTFFSFNIFGNKMALIQFFTFFIPGFFFFSINSIFVPM